MRNINLLFNDEYLSEERFNRDDEINMKLDKVDLNMLVEEQAQWLRIRGYDEKGLNNNEQKGSYKEHLKEELRHIIDSDIVLLDKEPFIVHSFGLFGEKDKVHFAFNYEFNSLEKRVFLKEVEATLNQVPIAIKIETMDDLWNSKDLYQRVKEFSSTVNKSVEENRNKLLQDIISREIDLLYNEGYIGNFEKRFTNEIMIAESAFDKEHHFIIKGKTKIDNNHPKELNYRFSYSYNPQNTKLQVKSIYAHVGHISRIVGTNCPIPPALDVYKYLLSENKTALAKKIVDLQSKQADKKLNTLKR